MLIVRCIFERENSLLKNFIEEVNSRDMSKNILTQVTSDEKKRDRKTMILIKSIFSILLISFVECLFYFGSTLEEMRKGLH